jgi:hypothetical protein
MMRSSMSNNGHAKKGIIPVHCLHSQGQVGSARSTFAVGATTLSLALIARSAIAAPESGAFVGAPAQIVASAAAPLGGLTAMADPAADSVTLYDAAGTARRTLTRGDLTAVLPWMGLNTDADGPCALTFSDSGRLLFIAVCDTAAGPDGQPADAILRYDTQTDQLAVYLRFELGGFNPSPRPMLAHFKGRLYLSSGGNIRTYNARVNDATGSQVGVSAPGAASNTVPMAIDRATGTMYAANAGTLLRASLTSTSLTFTSVGTVSASSPIRGLAWSDTFGGAGQGGLYVQLNPTSPSPASPYIMFVPPAMARGTGTFAPVTYLTAAQAPTALLTSPATGLSSRWDGALVHHVSTAAHLLTDTSDTRLTFDAWRADEFAQVVMFGKDLVSPDGEPAGWVIDADVIPAWNRFHPATPDAAAWVILLCLMNDQINNDPDAEGIVAQILTRYAGLAPDGIAPSRSADGIFRHWIDPLTGNAKPGWDPEYATLSTMKIVLAAARARAFYPDNAQVRVATNRIICGVTNWDAYFDQQSRTFFKGLAAGGRDGTSISSGWHESVLFAEQAAAYGTSTGPAAGVAWLDRTRWPVSSYVTGRLVTGTSSGSFSPTFISVYPLLTSSAFRESALWQSHVQNIRASHAAWTDDNGPLHATVFSAGTTKSEWGGYNADSLSNRPGNVTTFPALMGLAAATQVNTGIAAAGPLSDAAAAYAAYRAGARQTFKGGASILYRRSDIDRAYTPNSAGLPDVAMGALGLAALLQPGSVEAVLTGQYPSCSGNQGCPSDWNQDGGVDGADVEAFFFDWVQGAADLNEDGGTDGSDVDTFFGFWQTGC